MRVVRAVMPNGMPFLIQTVIRSEDNCIHPEDIKMYPLLVDGVQSPLILEELDFPDIRQKTKLAVWLCNIINKK